MLAVLVAMLAVLVGVLTGGLALALLCGGLAAARLSGGLLGLGAPGPAGLGLLLALAALDLGHDDLEVALAVVVRGGAALGARGEGLDDLALVRAGVGDDQA